MSKKDMDTNISEALEVVCENCPRFDGYCPYVDAPEECPILQVVEAYPELVCSILNIYYADWPEKKIPDRIKICKKPWKNPPEWEKKAKDL